MQKSWVPHGAQLFMPREPGLGCIDCRIYIVALVDASQKHGNMGLAVVFPISIRSAAFIALVHWGKMTSGVIQKHET